MLPLTTVAKPVKPLLPAPALLLIIAQAPRIPLAPTVLFTLIAPVAGSAKAMSLATPLRVIVPRVSVDAPPVAPAVTLMRLSPQPIVVLLNCCVLSVLALPVIVRMPSPLAVVGESDPSTSGDDWLIMFETGAFV